VPTIAIAARRTTRTVTDHVCFTRRSMPPVHARLCRASSIRCSAWRKSSVGKLTAIRK
jgi:hypothetical protein